MSWPFQQFDAAPLLDGSLAGDAGFDPLRIATSQKQLFALREAEVKHSRLAMLAALGWPVSELYHYQLASYFGSDLVQLGTCIVNLFVFIHQQEMMIVLLLF